MKTNRQDAPSGAGTPDALRAAGRGPAGLPLGDQAVLRKVFGLICGFGAYLLVVEVLNLFFRGHGLRFALLRLIPYGLFLVAVGWSTRPLVRAERKTLLIALFLTCVLVVYLTDVTRFVPALAGIPILGPDSPYRGDVKSFAEAVAIFSFLAASYFAVAEAGAARSQLVEEVEKLRHAEQGLQKSREQLRALSSRLQTLREEERTHVAREIHDHLGQLLTALKLELRAIERRASGLIEGELRAALDSKLRSAKELTDEIITSVQKIASELRPGSLDQLGLGAAIEAEAAAFESRTGIACRCRLETEPAGLGPDAATAVFRIFQEVLTNVARHAHASAVSVKLSSGDQGLVLEVADDGVGIRAVELDDPRSLGLLGMRERAAMLGGQVALEAGGSGGTTVRVQVPLPGSSPPTP